MDVVSLQAAVFKELVVAVVLVQQVPQLQQKLEQMAVPEYYLILPDLIHIVQAEVVAEVEQALAQVME